MHSELKKGNRQNREKEGEGLLGFSAQKWDGGEWLEGMSETQAELELRLRGRARAELGLLREEPGLEARGGNGGGLKIGGGCGRAGAGARARGPSFTFSQLFPWPAAGRERNGGEAAGVDIAETSGENFIGETESEMERGEKGKK